MDELIKQGATAAKAGDKETARNLLNDAVKQFPDDERAWGWLYNVCKTDQERINCLQQIIRINPKNDKANQLLEDLSEFEPPLEKPSGLGKFSKNQISLKQEDVNDVQSVILEDINIPFWSIVNLIIKFWFASLFLTIILGVALFSILMILGAIFGTHLQVPFRFP